MKSILLIFILIGFGQTSLAGQVTLAQTTIELHPVGKNRFSFRFCEMGLCRDFGNPRGYDLEAFENMNHACLQKRRINPIAASVLDGLSYTALLGLATGPGILVFVAGQTTARGLERSVDKEAVRLANDLMPALSRNQGTFEFLFDDFVNLKRGLEYCHRLYETTPGIWLDDCDRDLACKKDLAKSLDISPKRLKSLTAHEIYTLKIEKQTADTLYQSEFPPAAQ